MKRLRKLIFMSLTLGMAAGLGACGDDPTDVLQDFDGDEVAADLQASMAVFQASAQANSFLGRAMASLGEHGIVFEPTTGEAVQAPQMGAIRAIPLAQASVTFPDSVLGQTFVYNADTGEWEVDETRTDAPANGIRIIWYATDGVGTPLSGMERGYFDLTDEDGDGLNRLGVEIVSTENGLSTLADYTIGFAFTDDDVEWTERFVVDGFVSNVDRQLEFHVEAEADSSYQTGDQNASLLMTFQGDEASYEFDLAETYSENTGIYEEDLSVSFTQESATTELVLSFSGAEAATDGGGTLSHQGVPIAEITAQPGSEFTFTKPGGGTFSQADREQLEEVVGTMFLSGFYLLLSIPLIPLV